MLAALTITAATTSIVLLEDLHSEADATVFGEIAWLYKKRHAKNAVERFIYKYRWWQTMLRLQIRLRWLVWPFVGIFNGK